MTAREVELAGGAPWGFRMHGGADQNQPLRISRVNPGRKASLSGIREGDVISSINGHPTRGITNAEAHAMLRQAGPVLKLGLNEDREMSPRRRSIGKGGELKRPSQLISDMHSTRATPQAPVYATIRPPPSPLARPAPPALRSSLNSLPTALSSTPLVKSVGAPEEPIKIHPTNPFYTNSPPNAHSSPSKLPVPNGRPSYSSLDRSSKPINYLKNPSDNYDGLKSPSFFTKSYDSGPSSLPPGPGYASHNSDVQTNGFANQSVKFSTSEVKHEPFSYDSLYSQSVNNGLPNVRANTESSREPFDTTRLRTDPFEKYLRANKKENDCGRNKISNSLSENNFTEEVTQHYVTEHKISEIEEVKTIKKIILNGSGDESQLTLHDSHFTPTTKQNQQFDFKNHTSDDYRREHSKTFEYSPSHNIAKDIFKEAKVKVNGMNSSADRWNEEGNYSTSSYYSMHEKQNYASPTAAEASIHDVASKPPLRPPSSPAPAHPASPTSKRE